MSLSARTLILSLGVLVLALSAACVSGSQNPPDLPPLPEVSAVVITRDLAVGDNRVAFGLVDLNGMPVRAEEAKVRALLLPPGDGAGEERASGVATFQKWRLGEQGTFSTTLNFDTPGFWEVEATVTGEDGETIVAKGAVEVKERSETPAVGDPAPRSVTATLSDTADITTISSDYTPDPDLYQLSVHQALEEGKPVLIAFSTPRFCVSATCGPQLDVVSELKERYRGQANFIHVEVFKDPHLIKGGRPPSGGYVDAIDEWSLPSEPWTFVIDRAGKVYAKFEQFAPADEIEAALKEVL